MALNPLPSSLARHRRELTKFWLRMRVPIVAGVAALALLGGGLYGWMAWQRSSSESQQHRVQASATWVVQDVKSTLDGMLSSVDAAIDDAALARLLADGDPAALRAQEAALAGAIPHTLGVRIFVSVLRDPDYAAMPPVTYASLEMMRAAAESATASPPEVLLLGEQEQHIAVVWPVASAGTVHGFVLLGLDVALLGDAVAKADMPAGYAELVQTGGKGTALVGKKGNAAFKQGVPSAMLPVPGSHLRVLYWGETQAAAPAEEGGLPLLPLLPLAAGLLVLGGAGFVLMRRRAAARAAQRGDGEAAVRVADAAVPGLSEKLAALHEQDASGEPAAARAAAPAAESAASGAEAIADEIFRAYDVRGVVGKTLSVDAVRRLGQAIGSEAYDRGQQTLCVGYDGRLSSPELAAALIQGLRASGRDVIDVGRVPTPVLYFATYYLETGSGVMVTGSHNPPQYNGLKIMLGGDTLFGDDIQALRTRIGADDLHAGAGNLQSMDISADYIRRVSEDVPVALGNAFKVVIDCGNGVAGDFAPKLMRALGHDVVELYCEIDGNFPNHHPDPSQPENLADLIAAVKEHDADLGFAFDGDGDRLGMVDASGRIVWPDTQMMLFARDVLSRNAGAEIVFDVKCSSRLGKVIAKLGGKPVMYKTGHSFIKNKLKETGAPLAGEMSGHIFFKERWYGFDDALYAASRMLEILMGFKQKPTEVFSKLPAGVSTPELRVDMKEGENLSVMASLADTGQFADARVSTIDGVRVDWKDGWGLVRASNTTPSLVLRFEGDNEQALARIKETFRKLLLDKNPDLSLPF
jgi:phosphomannomutase/phosphoglucomutase